MALERIKTDGTETGMTAAEKINAVMDKVEIFEYNNLAAPVEITGTAWQDIIGLDTSILPEGVYSIKAHLVWTLDTTTRSGLFRFSTDNGATWTRLSKELKDNTNVEAISFEDVVERLIETAQHIKLQGRKERNANTMLVKKAIITIKKEK
jgi:hypothetical protein